MDTHGVYVLHTAYGQGVSNVVPDHFDFYLVPAFKITLDQSPSDGRSCKGIFHLDYEVFNISDDRVARSSKREVGAKYKRKRRMHSKFLSTCDRRYPPACDYRLTGIYHCLPERFPALCTFDRFRLCAQDPASVFVPHSSLIALHTEVKPRLSTQCRNYTIRPVFRQDLLHYFGQQRLYTDDISNGEVRLYSGRVAVKKEHFAAFLFERTAGLTSGVIKLSGLSYAYRSRAKDKYSFYAVIFHCYLSPDSQTCETKSSNMYPASSGPGDASG